MGTLKKLQGYMGQRRILFPLSLILSALSALAGLVPYILIWLIVKELLVPETTCNTDMMVYAWWAAGLAVGGVLLYFAALMASHLAAFRVESNIRRDAMKRVVAMPLGFFDQNTSGRIRKIIDDNASITHTFLAHQLPDLAATVLMPLLTTVLIFAFDWQLGLACLVPVLVAMGLMTYMMNGNGREFMSKYMTALEEMNTEAVEYVRGIPVVKVFQQTIYSFKNFHLSIMNYNRMVTAYTRMWCHPMTFYTVIINGFAFFLAPVSILMIGRGDEPVSVLVDFFLFILLTPLFSQSIMKSMYLQQATGQAGEAINRLEDLLNYEVLKEAVNSQKPKRFDIMFEHVSFSYPGTGQKVIDNISFKLPQGQTYALVGASGSGKTTIARLLPRFWDVQEGRISIGGVDVRDISKESLMDSIAFVFQQAHLFKTTLWENHMNGLAERHLQRVLSAVIVYLLLDFTIQDIDSAFSPNGGIFQFRKENTGINHTLGFKQQVVTFCRIIFQEMYAMAVIIDDKLGQELRSKRRCGTKQKELAGLVLQTVADFQLPPCKIYIVGIFLYLTGTDKFELILLHVHQRVFLNPIHILMYPLLCIFLISGDTVCLAHRRKPLMTMKLPTQLIVFYRPVLPVNIFAVVVGRLIAFMYKEGMLQSIIRPFLFFPGYSEFFQVYIRMCNTGTATVIIQQFLCRHLPLLPGACRFYFLQTRIIQIYQFKSLLS